MFSGVFATRRPVFRALSVLGGVTIAQWTRWLLISNDTFLSIERMFVFAKFDYVCVDQTGQ